MVSWTAVVGIALVALGLVLTPGPNMIYLVSRTLAQGRTAGLVSLLGVAVGFLCYLVGSAVGLTALFTVVPFLYDAVKLLGAGYLLWLAWQNVRAGKPSLFTPAAALSPDPPRKLLLPQFIDPARGGVASQALLLGLVQISIALTVNCLIVLAAGGISRWLTARPAWLRLQRWFMATVLGALALRLVTDRRPAVVS